MRPGVMLCAVVLGGCVETSTVLCADGSSCPDGKVCVRASESLTVCAAPDNGECENLDDGELCAIGGRCYDHVCVPIACGDHIVDPSEACDGGNTVGGDGCSADCRSDEKCGTGVLDPALGEACDDGNPLAHDGCSFDCQLETPHWTKLEPSRPLRVEPSLAFDSYRGRVVVVGGSESETLEWSGYGWTLRPSQFAPYARYGQATAYDVARKNLVMFGGTAIVEQGDTWLLDQNGWTLASSMTPMLERRSHHAMAYDPVRERVVLFGGQAPVGFGTIRVADTWEWDGATWVEIPTTGGPSARERHALAYDPSRGTIILFGGLGATGELLDDTWEWNGTSWTQLMTIKQPNARRNTAMTTYRGGLLLYGGTTAVGASDETWRWIDSKWKLVGPGAVGPRASAGLATDVLRDRVVLFGGADGGGTTPEPVWEWNGTSWKSVDVLRPAAMSDAAVAFDERRGRAVVVGEGATFELVDESSWVTVTASSPPRRARHGLAYDSARDEVVMFGGQIGVSLTAETWVLAASGQDRAWIQRVPALVPIARAAQGLAYDAARARAVMFGGEASTGALGDTWEWDGTNWYDMRPATSPIARSSHALGYDPIRRVTVLFGGIFLGNELGDTWEWNGTAWKSIVPVGPAPIARAAATLTWNPVRRRLTLVGGVSGFALGRLADTWEWDGTSWTEVPVELRPPGTSNHVTTRSNDGRGLIMFSGQTFGPTADVWRLRWEGTALDEVCGGRIDRDGDSLAGCADPDCWAVCSPLCGPGVTCAASSPRCGDGVADPIETCQQCPGDVAACPSCGDLLCETPETITTCPGDCAP